MPVHRDAPPVPNRFSEPSGRQRLLQALTHAAMGEPEFIAGLASTREGVTTVIQNRLAPLMAILAHQHGMEIPEEWSAIMRQTAIMRILLDNALTALGSSLDAAGIPWMPLKGMGPVAGFYPSPECRPTTDLDVLVPEQRFLEAREALRQQGWTDIHPGPLHEDFLLKEGYNWKARHTSGVMLELHFRLWGPVDPSLPAAILDAALPASGLGTMARLSGPQETYIVAACHLWNSPLPVALVYFLDLHLISRAASDDPAFAQAVIAAARRHDVQLFVGLAAAAAGRLWENTENAGIAHALFEDLRPAERVAAARALRRSPPGTSLGTLVLARLLSGRKSRTGWRAPFRRIWPHPAIVMESAAHGPLSRARRLYHRARHRA